MYRIASFARLSFSVYVFLSFSLHSLCVLHSTVLVLGSADWLRVWVSRCGAARGSMVLRFGVVFVCELCEQKNIHIIASSSLAWISE